MTVASHDLIFPPFSKVRNPKYLAGILWQGMEEGSFPEGWNRVYCILPVCPEGEGSKGMGVLVIQAHPHSPVPGERREGRE